MSANTKIEWADHTFNPWEGCQKVGPGCDNCYAESRNVRFGGGAAVNWGPAAPRRRTSAANWNLPRRWNALADAFMAQHGRRQRVFCASLADVFDNAVDPAWRMDLFKTIAETPHLDWLVLTKRIGNVMPMCTSDSLMFDLICERVWLGATIVNQKEADRDIPKLLTVPAAKHFVSMEPLLGAIDLTREWLAVKLGTYPFPRLEPEHRTTIVDLLDWVIVGGESGPGARPMHPGWVRNLRDQCTAAGVPFLFKQWGEWVPRSACYHIFEDGRSLADIDPGARQWPCIRLTEQGHNGRALANSGQGDHAYMQRIGKKVAGRLLSGRTWDEVPS